MKGSVQAQCTNTHIYNGGTVVAVCLVQGKLATVANALQEVSVAWLWVRHLVDELLHIGDGALEALVNLTLWTFDVRYLTLTLEAFAFQNNLATILVSVCNASPDTHCIGMLLRSVYLHLNGEGVVLAKDVLNGVDVMLTHIGQTTAVIVE